MERLPFYRRIGHLGPDFGRGWQSGVRTRWYVCHTVGGHLCPTNFKGNITFPIDLSDGEVKPFISDALFLASPSILWSFHHLRRILGAWWAHTCSSVTFSLKDQQHLRLQTEWNNRLTNQQSGHILRLWWRLSTMAPAFYLRFEGWQHFVPFGCGAMQQHWALAQVPVLARSASWEA